MNWIPIASAIVCVLCAAISLVVFLAFRKLCGNIARLIAESKEVMGE